MENITSGDKCDPGGRARANDSGVDCGHLFWLAFWQLNPTLMTADGRARVLSDKMPHTKGL